jgi:hypothetical protein
MPAALPDHPDIEQLKRHAKTLRDLVRGGADGAIALARAQHPRWDAVDPAAFRLSDAQLTLARHYGFASWPKLRAYVEMVNALTRSPHLVAKRDEPTDELLRLACLTYGADDVSRPRQAAALLAADPALAVSSVYAMAATGAAGALRALLDGDPTAVERAGGPFGWPPLLYATYSRVESEDPAHDIVAVVDVLLERGADANAGYLWDGLVPPFTALTGALGGGEGRQSRHPKWHVIATLLLDAGADANDGQGVYNRGLGDVPVDDVDWLELLYARGFGVGDGGPWHRRLAPHHPAPADLVAEVLQHAAVLNLPDRARLVLRNGADPNRAALHPIFGGRTPFESALRNGNLDIAQMLADAGADQSTVDDVDRYIGAVMAGEPSARGAERSLRQQALEREPALVVDAARLGRGAAVALLVELGWDVNARDRSTALHEAAWRGDAPLARQLLVLGADRTIRDTEFDGEPAGWAHHAGHEELAVELSP